jgi:hypothetical protein
MPERAHCLFGVGVGIGLLKRSKATLLALKIAYKIDSDSDADPEGLNIRPAVRGKSKPCLLGVVDYPKEIHV